MLFLKVLLTLAAVAGHDAALAINKCTNPDGGITYQDAPCPRAAKDEQIDVQKTPQAKPLHEDIVWRSVTGMANEKRLELLSMAEKSGLFSKEIRERRLVLGMPKELVALIKGSPDKINKTVSRGGISEQWVYRYKLENVRIATHYLYMQDGKLTVYQSE